MKRTILLSLSVLALLCAPGMAAADTAPASAAQGCNELSFLTIPAAAPAVSAAGDPLAGVVQASGGASCCVAKRVACQLGCACGVFEFNCDPASCQSSCICNICP